MVRRVVISGYYGFGNFGDEAILSLLIEHLKQLGLEPVVLSANPRKTSMDYFVNAVNSFNFYRVSGLIKQSDVLISGGGSLLQDVTSLKSLVYYLWVITTALRHKKRVIIFAQGIGPIKNKLAQFFTAKILKKCDYVSVRDLKSFRLLEHFKIKSDLLCDPIFMLKCPDERPKGTIGIQLRGFASLNDKLLNKLARRIAVDFSDKKIEIFAFQDTIDLETCVKFENILHSLNSDIKTEVLSNLSTEEVVSRVSSLEYMVAMRFHALVMAMNAGIKCIAVNYDAKVEKLAREAGIPVISMDAEEDFEAVFAQMKLLDEGHLKEFACSKHFDWTGIDHILLS